MDGDHVSITTIGTSSTSMLENGSTLGVGQNQTRNIAGLPRMLTNEHHSHNTWDCDRSLPQSSSSMYDTSSTVNVTSSNNPTTKSTTTSQYTRILNGLNRYLVLLLPFAFQQVTFLMRKQMHLLHIAFFVAMTKIFDTPFRLSNTFLRNQSFCLTGNSSSSSSALPQKEQEKRCFDQHVLLNEMKQTATNTTTPTSINKKKSVHRVLVIGDSLAIGLGCVNVFDKEKNNSVPYYLVENPIRSHDRGPGPVFPQVLASTLAIRQGQDQQQQHPIYWRSAGVDGGTIHLIHEFCIDMIRHEVQNLPHSYVSSSLLIPPPRPDCVVLLCSVVNDLKQVIANPNKSITPIQFRNALQDFITEIRTLIPSVQIIIPALPTPIMLFHHGSPLNIFPLSICLDMIIGYYDYQKKVVADRFPNDEVMYIPIDSSNVNEWYNSPLTNEEALLMNNGRNWMEMIQYNLVEEEQQQNQENCSWNSTMNNKPPQQEQHPKIKNIVMNRNDKHQQHSLIAIDGIHPSAKCYALWAIAVANCIVLNRQ